MRFQVSLAEDGQGGCIAQCDEYGVRAVGASADSALDELRVALHYQVEFCPCHGVDPDSIEFDILS